ncbi:hypothetical protein ACWC4J_36385 [Streptomyces sp. NPDC001356]
MSHPLPQLPKPEFALIAIEPPPEVPTEIAVDLRSRCLSDSGGSVSAGQV